MKKKSIIIALSAMVLGSIGMIECGYAATELEGYIGENLNTASNDFRGMSEIAWSMNTAYRSNEWIAFGSSIDNPNYPITKIILSETEESYFLCGVHPLMTLDEISEVMEENGGWRKIEYGNCWYNEERSDFFFADEYDGDTSLALTSVEFGSSQGDRTEVFYYIGETMEQVMEEISDLTLRTEEEKVLLEGDGICFSGYYESGDPMQAKVKCIEVIGQTSEYCIYGYNPKDIDAFETNRNHGFESGGSGEYDPPVGDVLLLWPRDEDGFPVIQLGW